MINGSELSPEDQYDRKLNIKDDLSFDLSLNTSPSDNRVDKTIDYIQPVCNESDAYFGSIVDSVKAAIEIGQQPLLIRTGSSGSYFCRDNSGSIVGVFKPMNEEPYGKMNPKWTKWLHKHLFPCCFGRSCLIPNLGYISEAAASTLDRCLGLHITPRTEIVRLGSPAFSYSRTKRRKKQFLPKIGSFQLFLKGFQDAQVFLINENLLQVPNPAYLGSPISDTAENKQWSVIKQKTFRWGFERLCVLDYIMRNTDRALDNWMVHENSSGEMQIAAIDNGLAFPYKHPDRLRSYPYGWSFLGISRVAFSKETAELLLPKLRSDAWWEATLAKLEALFSTDKNFDSDMWGCQKAVLRGQGYNLVYVLELSEWLRAQLEYQVSANLIEWPSDPDEQQRLREEGLCPVAEIAERLAAEASPYGLVQLSPLVVYDVEDDNAVAEQDEESLLPSVRSGSPVSLPDKSFQRASPPRKPRRVLYFERHMDRKGQTEFIQTANEEPGLPQHMKRGYQKAKKKIINFAKRPWLTWC